MSSKSKKMNKAKKGHKLAKTPSKKPASSIVLSAPAAMGVDGSCDMSWSSSSDGGTAQGREYLGQVVVPADEEVGSNCTVFYISPAEFGGTRLALKSQEYQKFKFEELDFEYSPAVGSETPGSLVFAYNRDIAASMPAPSEQGLRSYMALKDAKHGNVWAPHITRCPVIGQKDTLWTVPEINGDDRLGYQGQFFVAIMVPTGLTPGAVLGTIIVKYRCKFEIQTLEDELEGAEVSSDGSSTLPTTVAGDFLGKVNSGAEVVEGDPTYAPQILGDGSYAITLREGLYRVLSWIASGTYAGAGLMAIDNPVLEVFDADSADQVAVSGVMTSSSDGSGGIPVQEAYVSVPRGGARMRQNYVASSTISATAATCLVNVLRIAGYVSTVLGVISTPEEVRAIRALRSLRSAQRTGTVPGSRYLAEGYRPTVCRRSVHKVGGKTSDFVELDLSIDGVWSLRCSCGFDEDVPERTIRKVAARHCRHAQLRVPALVKASQENALSGAQPSASIASNSLPSLTNPTASRTIRLQNQ